MHSVVSIKMSAVLAHDIQRERRGQNMSGKLWIVLSVSCVQDLIGHLSAAAGAFLVQCCCGLTEALARPRQTSTLPLTPVASAKTELDLSQVPPSVGTFTAACSLRPSSLTHSFGWERSQIASNQAFLSVGVY